MIVGSLAILCCGGCRGNGWPWQAKNTTPNAPQVASNGPWQPEGVDSPVNRLTDIFRRQDEQTRLANEQRQALGDLAEWQRRQEEQVSTLALEKQQQRMAELQGQADVVAQQKEEIERLADLRRRALELDSNNSELHAQLAQTQQQNRLLEDQMQLLQQQLTDAAQQLEGAVQARQQTEQRVLQAQSESQQRVAEIQRDAEQRVRALQASAPPRGSATITANSSLQRKLTPVSVAGLLVRQDGDVIRIELPSDQIFSPGTAALSENSMSLIDQLASTVRQNYPEQIIGIESHTDNRSLQGGVWRSPHQLTAAQAMAVFEHFAQRHQFPPQQLFVLGHGANYPVASNATAAGQQRNRRVEIVIYPETVGQR